MSDPREPAPNDPSNLKELTGVIGCLVGLVLVVGVGYATCARYGRWYLQHYFNFEAVINLSDIARGAEAS